MTKTDVLKLLAANRQRRFRHQEGSVVERQDGFYIRYYQDRDGVRTKVTEKLCDRNAQRHAVNCHAVTLLQRSHMSAVNNAHHTALQSPLPAPVLTVGAFFDTVYWPWVEANKRESTQRGYDYDWRLYVAPELQTRPIDSYTTVDACDLLDRMASRLNQSTLGHVKSLCSGIFSHACRKGIIAVNPWREASCSVKVRKSKPRVKYTPEETSAILKALDRSDAKLFFALVAVMGMRPSEAAAVKWEHLDWKKKTYRVCEAAPYGKLGDTKTERSKRTLHVIEPVLSCLKAWHTKNDKPTQGLLFTNGNGGPVNHNNFARAWIAPQAKKVCPRWCGLYSGRHGTATALLNLTGDIRASYQALGNSLEVVMATYVEPDVSAGAAGMAKYEHALKKSRRTTKTR